MLIDRMGDIERWTELRLHLDAARPWIDPMAAEIVREAEAEEKALREQLRGAVAFSRAELEEVEFALRQRLDEWDDPDREALAATKRAHRKALDRLARQ